VANSVQNAAAEAKPAVVDAAKSAAADVKSSAKAVSNEVKDTARQVKPSVVDATKNVAADAKSSARTVSNEVKDTARQVKPSVVDAAKSASQDAKSASKDAANSVKDAAQNAKQPQNPVMPIGHPIAPPTPPMDKDRIVIEPNPFNQPDLSVNPRKIDTETAVKKIRRDELNLDEPKL